MGVNRNNHGPRRAYYPSGPWIDGIRPPESSYSSPSPPPPTGNPDPKNYQIVRAEEYGKYLIVQIKYPDCTNYEGNKIMVFQGSKLLDLVNQRLIDPHFFKDKKLASPIARFVPTEDGWKMANIFVNAMLTVNG